MIDFNELKQMRDQVVHGREYEYQEQMEQLHAQAKKHIQDASFEKWLKLICKKEITLVGDDLTFSITYSERMNDKGVIEKYLTGRAPTGYEDPRYFGLPFSVVWIEDSTIHYSLQEAKIELDLIVKRIQDLGFKAQIDPTNFPVKILITFPESVRC